MTSVAQNGYLNLIRTTSDQGLAGSLLTQGNVRVGAKAQSAGRGHEGSPTSHVRGGGWATASTWSLRRPKAGAQVHSLPWKGLTSGNLDLSLLQRSPAQAQLLHSLQHARPHRAGLLLYAAAEQGVAFDKEIILAAVQNDPDILDDLEPGWKADRDVVAMSIQQTGSALRHAAPRACPEGCASHSTIRGRSSICKLSTAK